MNVLWLGPCRQTLDEILRSQRDSVSYIEDPVAAGSPHLTGRNFLVSYGYRHRVPREVLEQFPGRAVNLHISYLPWNRGADPNLWSFLEDTPKGVSIHRLAEELDAGELLCQERLDFFDDETLRSTYDALSRAMEALFRVFWPSIKRGRQASWPQPAGGSFHRTRDAEPYRHLLKQGWDTPVRDLIGKAKCRV